MTDRDFDRINKEIASSELSEKQVAEATERVWQRIVEEAAGDESPLTGCADYQALIPDLLNDRLPAARALLVRDHTRGCVPCRRALMAARSDQVETPSRATARRSAWRMTPALRLAAAAVLVLGITALGFNFVSNTLADRRIGVQVEVIDGLFQVVSGDDSRDLAAGDLLGSRRSMRTGKESGATLKLDDGSTIEMDERSEISVRGARKGTTIDLKRGNIIVHAADQGRDRLYVSTGDCDVAVKGTIFSVAHGLKGSRVSVIEGEVEVRQGDRQDLLAPGEQVTTDDRLAKVAVEDEISWSRNAEEHIALMRELRALQRDLSKAVDVADARTSTRLLDLAPADTLIYAGIPNLTEGIVAAREVFESRLAQSPVLDQWWQANVVDTGVEAEIEETLDRLQPLGEAVGDEVVVAVPSAAINNSGGPLVMATLSDPAGFQAMLSDEVARINAEAGEELSLIIVDDLAAAEQLDSVLYLWVVGDLFAAAPDLSQLVALAAVLDVGSSEFSTTQLHARLSATYAQGVEWVFGVDLHSVIEQANDGGDLQMVEQLGILDATTLIIERHSDQEMAFTEAALDFDGPRRGAAAWLAEPAPMGSLDFVSPEASMVGALVAKDAAVMFDELIAALASVDPDAVAELAAFESEYGFNLRNDLAATLGGEAAIALDGPVLPTPAWKLIIEVYDPTTLLYTIERAVAELNRALAEEGHAEVQLITTVVDDREYHRIDHPEADVPLVFTVVDGFLILAPNQALIEQTLRFRAAGITISTSSDFRNMLPQNGYTDCSALSYRNLGKLADAIPGAALSGMPAEALAMIEEGSAPSLYCVYGEEQRIVLSGSGGSLFAMAGLMGLPAVFEGPELMESLTQATETGVSSEG